MAGPHEPGQTRVLTLMLKFRRPARCAKEDKRLKSQDEHHTVFSRKRRVQRSFQGQLHTQDESDLLGSHLIFSAHIQIPPGSFCAVSTFYLKKINTSFFPWSDRGTLFVAFARSPPHLRNVKDLKPWIKGTFLINIFFFLKRFFLFKSCFSLFISVLKVLLS